MVDWFSPDSVEKQLACATIAKVGWGGDETLGHHESEQGRGHNGESDSGGGGSDGSGSGGGSGNLTTLAPRAHGGPRWGREWLRRTTQPLYSAYTGGGGAVLLEAKSISPF